MNGFKKGLGVGIGVGVVAILVFQLVLMPTVGLGRIVRGRSTEYANDAYGDFAAKVEDVIGVLDVNYYEDIDEQALYEAAFRGVVDSVGDPYTTYFTEEEYSSFMESMEGVYSGIGVVISYGETEKEVVVVAPFEGSPGDVAGIKPGDQIIRVDGNDIEGWALDQLVERIKGEKNTEVVLTILRNGEVIDIPVIRDDVEIPTVEYTMLEDNIGYVSVRSFDIVTEEQFREAIETLNTEGQEGMIIDLRFNPGGYLHIAYNMLDMLMEEDLLVVYTEDKNENRSELITETKEAFNKPLVLLVNGASASASEVMSGALQDHELGTVVGETTFGKGLVQQTIELDDNSAIKVTVSRYYTPDGAYIQDVGIEPDVYIEEDYENDVDDQLEKAVEVIQQQLQ